MALVHMVLLGAGTVGMLMSLVGLWLPMHTVAFFTAHVIRVFVMQTYLRVIVVDKESSDFDAAMGQMDRESWKDKMDGEVSIQDVAHRFCARGVQTVFPDLCAGLTNAHYLGLAVLFIFSFNLAAEALAFAQYYDYVANRPKKDRRTGAFVLLISGGTLCMVALVTYGFGVLMYIDNMQPMGFAVLAFSPAQGTGISSGFIFLCFGALLQVGVAMGIKLTPLDGEEFEAQRREIELQQSAAGFPGHPPGYHPGGGMPSGAPKQWQQSPGQGFAQQPAAVQHQWQHQPPAAPQYQWQQGPGPGYAQQPAAVPLWQGGPQQPVVEITWQTTPGMGPHF